MGNKLSFVSRNAEETTEVNPLQNEIVISKILSFLEIEDVKSCRLINKQWSSNGYRILKQISRPYINLSSEGGNATTLSRRLELFTLLESESGSQLPLGSEIATDTPFLEILEGEGNLLRFLKAVSPKLNKLRVDVWTRKAVVYEIGFPNGLSFPHLQSIQFRFDNYQRGLRKFWQFEVFRAVIQNSPKLENIQLCLMLPEILSDLILLPLVVLLRQRQVSSRLTSLLLDDERILSSFQFDQLAEIGMKLKRLRVHPSQDTVASVKRFLKGQLESLEELEITFGSAHFELERVPKLKILRICFNYTSSSINHHILYNELFPALEHLQLEYLNRHEMDMFLYWGRNEEDIRQNVKTLTIKGDEGLSPEHIENAAHLFPNLTKLQIPTSLEILKKVYIMMGKLQELALVHFVEPASLEGPNQSHKIDNLFMGVEPGEVGRNETNFNPAESLLALTKLRALRISCRTNDIIGEQVCRQVFMKMESLKFIKFYDRRFAEGLKFIGVSSFLLDEMREKMAILETHFEAGKNLL